MNNGSLDNLNVSAKCGLRPELLADPPDRRTREPGLGQAIEARDQCVASRGVRSSVATITASMRSISDRARRTRSRLVEQAVQAAGSEPGPPALHGRLIHPQIRGSVPVRPAFRAAQHDLCPQRQVLGGLRAPGPPDQLGTLGLIQHQRCAAPPGRRSVLEPGQPLRGELTPPLGHRLDRHSQLPCGFGIRHPPGTRQDDPGPVSPPAPRQPSTANQLSPLILRQHDLHSRRTRMRHHCRLAEITLRTSGGAH